jgi:NAD(P)-dependent dehydrogenase (short-subunit alcohol dehydrogenase family)
MKDVSLSKQVAFITGGAQGLGEALSRVLGEEGATVVIGDIRRDNADALVTKLKHDGIEAMAVSLDVADEQQAQAGVDSIQKAYGGIDILVNNAAADKTVSIEELSFAEWDRILGTNLRGPFVMSKIVLPLMRQKRSGHIINIASTAAKRAWANASAYHASKWGVLGFSHALHVEARAVGVKVTAIVAGGMRTPFLLDRFPDIDIGTLQDPRNVAETIRCILHLPMDSVVPEITIIPMRETSWP